MYRVFELGPCYPSCFPSFDEFLASPKFLVPCINFFFLHSPRPVMHGKYSEAIVLRSRVIDGFLNRDCHLNSPYELSE